jgi:phosphopantothenoylcysteine decarboxylase/phosphopantothenate--cysteine ligase
MPTPLRAIVTLGPTHEPLDDVRFVGNRSSGRMGLEIARALMRRGCQVTAMAGPCQPAGLDSLPEVVRFRTAEELRASLRARWPDADLLVMAAAVADWRPMHAQTGKRRRGAGSISIELEPVPEILGSLASRDDQFVVGFALEPEAELLASARSKLVRKRADCIVANPLQTMDAADVDGSLVWADGRVERPDGACSKADFASWLADRVVPAASARAAR